MRKHIFSTGFLIVLFLLGTIGGGVVLGLVCSALGIPAALAFFALEVYFAKDTRRYIGPRRKIPPHPW